MGAAYDDPSTILYGTEIALYAAGIGWWLAGNTAARASASPDEMSRAYQE